MPDAYEIVCAGESLTEFKQLYQQARQGGFSGEFLAAARTITERLQSEPDSLGEPLYNVTNLNLVMWIGIVPPLSFTLASHHIAASPR